MVKNVNNISWSLFRYKGSHCYRNLKDIPIFFKRCIFTLQHGYAPQAKWETFMWFIDTMKEILHEYRYNRMGTSVFIENYFDIPDEAARDKANEEAYNELLDKMMELLDLMDECNEIYDDMDWREADEKRHAAKDEFFKLFSKYFYTLWD